MQQSQTEQCTFSNDGVEAVDVLDERSLLLEEVNFKWLMAGLGWWVDMAQFTRDPLYAARYLTLAKSAESAALRKCAAALEWRSRPH
ncbi:MAG: hypothetical protein PHQ58_13030 [Rhodoferax sp.]|uniref:hypothetical protein n=1 Tax=Rhodoferax sp. TaxID=50421 RepID=UPI00261F61E6|nr:hypothetical protein [Rhodoferax sp.]MDD2881351.1 hypothetical protein [Rhodoferax sp.]